MAASSVLLGVVVLVGWALHLPWLVQLLPHLSPMQGNTALCFICLGIGFFLTFKKYTFTAFGSALLPFLIGVLTLVEYLWGLNIGIDTLLFEPYILTNTPFPGRMGSNTAFCFLLLSLPLLLYKITSPIARTLSWFLPLLVFALALTSIICTVSDVRATFGFGDFTQMAVHTACGFFLLSGSSFLHVVQKGEKTKGMISPAALVAFVLSLTGALTLWQVARQREEIRIKQVVLTLARNATQEVKVRFRTRFQALTAMATRASYVLPVDRLRWELDAKIYLEFFPDIRSLAFLDSQDTIQWIYPLNENKSRLGIKLNTDPLRTTALNLARETAEIQITPPLELMRGGTGVVAFVPIVRNGGTYLGSVACSFRLTEIFDALFAYERKGDLFLQVTSGGRTLHSSLEQGAADYRQSQVVALNLLNQTWELKLAPTYAFLQKQYSLVPTFILFVGLLVTALLTIAVHMVTVAGQRIKEVELANNKFKSLFEGAPEAAIITSKSGVIEMVNYRAEKLFGYSRVDLIGRKMSAIVPEATFEETAEGHNFKPLDTDRPYKGLRKNGSELPLEISLSPLVTSGGTLIKYSIRDITARLKTEEKLREQEAKFAASSKMAALGEMASGIGHEINNPLAIIKGTAEDLSDLIEKGMVTPTTVISKLKKIEVTSTRIEKIIKSLRAFAREDGLEALRPAKLSTMLEDTLALCAESFKSADVKLTVSEISPALSVACRPVQISQVLLNILNNAFDAVAELSDRWIKLEIQEDGSHITIAITDSGKGIARPLQSKIMQPFFSTKEPGRGSGLGLSISKGIIESHNGTLTLNTSHSHTQFLVKIPKSPIAKPSPFQQACEASA